MTARRRRAQTAGLLLLIVLLLGSVISASADDVSIPCGGRCSFATLARVITAATTPTNFILSPGTYMLCNETAVFQTNTIFSVTAPDGALIDCQGNGPAFSVNVANASLFNTSVVISFSGFTIFNASNSVRGGAVSSNRTSLSLSGMTFDSCSALVGPSSQGFYGMGGAIYMRGYGTSLVVNNCTFTRNSATLGGAICADGEFQLPPTGTLLNLNAPSTFINVTLSNVLALANIATSTSFPLNAFTSPVSGGQRRDCGMDSGAGGFLAGHNAVVVGTGLNITRNTANGGTGYTMGGGAFALCGSNYLKLSDSVIASNGLISTTAYGGAIVVSGVTDPNDVTATISNLLNFDNCQFIGNSPAAPSCDCSGGHIYSGRGDVTMANCTMRDGRGPRYGGYMAFDKGALTATDSVFLKPTGAAWGSGTLVYGVRNVTLTRCTVSGTNGVSLISAALPVTIINSNITNNVVSSSLIQAPALYIQGSLVASNTGGSTVGASSLFNAGSGATVFSRNSTFLNNIAANGVMLYGGAGTFYNSTFIGNSATSKGGVIYVALAGTLPTAYFEGCSFIGNSAASAGGVASVQQDTLTVKGCVFNGNSAPAGGDFDLVGSTAYVSGSTFTNSLGNLGAVASIDSFGSLQMSNCTITGAISLSGAINIVTGSATISNSTISSCSSSDTGAAIYVGDHVVVQNTTLAQNNANTGGAIYFGFTSSGTITGSTFVQNTGINGGAIMFDGVSQGAIADTTFIGNSATLRGGGVATNVQGSVTMRGVTFDANTANGGGALSQGNNAGSVVAISKSMFVNNQAVDSGGGVSAAGTLSLTDVQFHHNSAPNVGGAILLANNAPSTMANVVIGDNSAGFGGGLSCSVCQVTVATSSFTTNSAQLGGALYCDPQAPSTGFSVDAATSFGGNFGSLELNPLQASCEPCGCCSYQSPIILNASAPCMPLPGRSCDYSCVDGYNQTFTFGLPCPSEGGVVDVDLACPAIACPPLSADFGMRIAISNNTGALDFAVTGDTADYTCVLGFKQVGYLGQRQCIGPHWTNTAGACNVTSCPVLGVKGRIANGSVAVERVFESGDNATYTCDLGFVLSTRDANRSCIFFGTVGQWQGVDPHCGAANCNASSVITKPLNLDFLSAGATGIVRQYSCDAGYQLLGGDATQVCIGPDWRAGNTTRVAITPNCTRQKCKDVGPTPGNCTSTNTSLYYQGVITYTCDPGYELIDGSETLQCVLNVNNTVYWQGVKPTCRPISCPSIPAPYITNCTEPFYYLQRCQMGCDAGFAGEIIFNYECSQKESNGAGNWTLPNTDSRSLNKRQDAYYPTCSACQVASYAPRCNDSKTCIPCTNAVTPSVRAESKADCLCNPGYFEADPADLGECTQCLAGGTCVGGHAAPVAANGFYLVNSKLIQCVPTPVCTGNNTCAEGCTGYLCSSCVKGYYKLNGYCHICPNNAPVIIGIGLVFGVIAVILLIISSRPGALRERSFGFGSVPTAIASVQMAASFYSFKLPWPTNTKRIFDVFSFANINLEIFSPECVVPFTYFDKIQATLAIPLVVLGVFVVVGLAWYIGIAVRARSLTVLKKQWRSIMSNLVAGYLNFLVLAYLLLARASLDPFACRTLADGKTVLSNSPQVECTGALYHSVLKFCTFGIVVYVVAVPLVLILLHMYYRPGEDALLDPLFSFYVAKYSRSRWYYEVVVLARKLAVVCFAVFIGDQAVLQAVCTIVLLFLFAVFTIIMRPFAWNKHNILEVVMLGALVIIIFGGLVMTFSTFRASVTADYTIVVVCIIAALCVGVVLVAELYANINARRLKKTLDVGLHSLGRLDGHPRAVALTAHHVLAVTKDGALVGGEAYTWKDAESEIRTIQTSSSVSRVFTSGALVYTLSDDGLLAGHVLQDRGNGLRLRTLAECRDLHEPSTTAASLDYVVVGGADGDVRLLRALDAPSHVLASEFSSKATSTSARNSTKTDASASSVTSSPTMSSSLSLSDNDSESVSDWSILEKWGAHENAVVAVAIARRRLYTADAYSVKAFRLPEATPLLHWDLSSLGSEITSLAVCGAQVAVSFGDSTIRILDERVATLTRVLHSHARPVRQLVARDMQVLSAGRDGVLKIWDSRRWVYLQTLARLSSAIACVAVHGDKVAVASSDGQISMVKIEPRWDIDVSRNDLYKDVHLPACCLKYCGADAQSDDSQRGSNDIALEDKADEELNEQLNHVSGALTRDPAADTHMLSRILASLPAIDTSMRTPLLEKEPQAGSSSA